MFNKVFFSAILAIFVLGQGVVSQNLGSVCGGASARPKPFAAPPAPSKSASPPFPTVQLLQIKFAGDKFNLFTFEMVEWIDRPARGLMIRMGSLRQWRQRRTWPGTGEFICQRRDGMHFDVDFLA
ncbi:hypothetical protein C8R44DRAFT_741933 [Mycena epipterygia]|nr:hypothetical protein C8R44DRAFT_741933 [Mycena epipterygia]